MQGPFKSALVAARWRSGLGAAFCLLAALVSGSVSKAQAQAARSTAFKLETDAFKPGADIPRKFTCDGEDVSPALTWSASPPATKSFALIVDDPDAPSGDFVHWVVFNLPAEARELREGVARNSDAIGGDKRQDGGGLQGQNDFGRTGYNGPCPPPGTPHRYFFRLYALNAVLNLQPGARNSKKTVEQAMKPHVLAKAELMGRYKR